MNLYFAALINTGMLLESEIYRNKLTPIQQEHRKMATHLLESYHYFNTDEQAAALRATPEHIFLDSGAFSAMTQGVDIDINEYCAFYHRNKDIIDVISVL